jgi:hypothetical protein
VRTHKFKNFARRVAEVDVDVHRTMGELRTAPLQGSTCFFHESLIKWQELNCGADFSAFCAETMQMCQSLPQLVLHQKAILGFLLARLTFEAKHSLEALMACLSALARDLRGDFLPHFGVVTARLSNLMKTGVEREPELLEHVFASLARMCKWLQRQLAADLPLALKLTRTLRRHRQQHVRLFAAQAVAFLLRAAPDAAVPGGVAALLEEASASTAVVVVASGGVRENGETWETRVSTRPEGAAAPAAAERQRGVAEDGGCEGGEGAGEGEEETVRAITVKEVENNVDGAGHLLAEAIKGAAHGLHSRAPRLLTRLLKPRLPRTAGGAEGDDVEKEQEEQGGEGGASVRLGRAYDVAAKAIGAVAQHTRRGKCAVMWEETLGAASRAASAVVRGLSGGGDDSDDEDDEDSDDEDDSEEGAASRKVQRAAHAAGVVATAVAVYNGARVEDYEPIFALLKKKLLPALEAAGKAAAAAGAAEESSGLAVALLAGNVHRLCLALTDAHNKIAGSSKGPSSVGTAAGNWGTAVAHAPLSVAFAFLGALRERAMDGAPAATAALYALLPAAAPTLVSLLDSGWDSVGGAGGGGDGAVDADAAAMLLGDVCDVLHKNFGDSEEEDGGADYDNKAGLVLSAAPAAAAAIVRRCSYEAAAATPAGKKSKTPSKKKGAGGGSAVPARRRWVLLRVLRHSADQAGARLATDGAIAWALGVLEGSNTDGGYAVGSVDDAAAVVAAAMSARAAFGPESESSSEDAGLAWRAAAAAKGCPGVLTAAAELLSGASSAVGSLEEALALHSPSLQSPSRHLRTAALRFLCAVGESLRETVDLDGAANDIPTTVCEMLARWLAINKHDAHDVVGLCKLNTANPALESASGFNPRAYKVMISWFQHLLSNSTCTATAGRMA